MAAQKTALLLLANGAEEMEAIITSDVLRRGGVKVTVAGLPSREPVTCARQTVVIPDAALADVKDHVFDVVVLPGGQPGSTSLAECPVVGSVLASQYAAGRYIAAICAAPIALKAHNIAPGALVTSYPSVKDVMTGAGYKYSEDDVVVSDKLITSRGPGTAFAFALKLVEILEGADKAKEVAKAMLQKY